ncbi:UDP-N-acetylmuramoyl-L-alanyl-D-glutamate--2,6-diaminopimelate ligase [Leptolyngbya valderiana BDU 20041]|nr:UDP-N-acetylmuramoyl-L-alanyl-D-glutamate--2,6-diaminopimelate ligase [Leptolyngbya valderiana BDU 20041]PPT10970.1 UDP-N-acetylmuramoylalanyl-D-glutamate--26-diaminopimelate ligase [Geitlerinema sp. FC II]
MKLRELLGAISPQPAIPEHPALDSEIKGLSTNSHACQSGDLFIGMPGTRVDGGEFWQGALDGGAVAAIVSEEAAKKYPPQNNECVVAVPDVTVACANLASCFYNHPGKTLDLVGVTGTNGKTTTTHLIEFLLREAHKPTALLGTLYARWPGFEKVAVHTTPFPIDLQGQLAQARDAEAEYAVMEVSSHALAQSRVLECEFQVAVFTNLTQDHLDYHKDMDDYFAAKALLFSPQYLKGRAIVNIGDPYGELLSQQIPAERLWTYSSEDDSADFYVDNLSYNPDGVAGTLHTPVGETAFELPLVGQYNIENMMAAVGAALHLGLDLSQIAAALPKFIGVPGRMERVQTGLNQDISVIVDYAHTPDSLENLLHAVRPFVPGRLICVFGCGGDRDRTKRPIMGEIAARLSDVAVVTSDNPRTEDPDRIIADVLEGIPEAIDPLVLPDRAEAIRHAILQAQPGDGVVIAGKGHEDYQILGTEKVHFDDREQARDALALRKQEMMR